MNTSWTKPKRNIFAAINDLKHALAVGYNARLIKVRNEDCEFPLKYIPRKSVLRMPKYTKYDFRIGDVIHGFVIEFQIPKKFSF